MTNRPPTFYAAVYLILRKGDSLLLLRRGHTGYMDGFWGVPSGHVEQGERIDAALLREMREEIGITLTEKDIRLAHVMHRVGERVYFDFFFTTETWTGEIRNAESDKHDEVAWFPVNSLPTNILPFLASALNYIRQDIFFSEDVFE